MKSILIVGLGSCIGGIARYLIALIIQSKYSSVFPIATFTINLIGCFAIGIVLELFSNNLFSEEWKYFLATGLLGGFTTYSAFSYETVHLLRTGETMVALSYLTASIILGLLFTISGIWIVKSYCS